MDKRFCGHLGVSILSSQPKESLFAQVSGRETKPKEFQV